MQPALRLLSTSWPRPVSCEGRRWVSEPDWDAPAMGQLPGWRDLTLDGSVYQALVWREQFDGGLNLLGSHVSGEMKGFHVVFRLRVERSGTLIFYDDDGCIVRRNGEIVHEDREVHQLTRHDLPVTAGDQLEIAQWQYHGDWIWAGAVEPAPSSVEADVALFAPYRDAVEAALRRPNGPVLKTYFAATHPVRSALSIYSMILNGYRPAAVRVFGEHQWDAHGRRAVQALLPFADVVPAADVEQRLAGLDRRLVPIVRHTWSAMKIGVSLFLPPAEYCFLDDDIFVLDPIDDALERFRTCDLVYAPDWNHDGSYRSIWAPSRAEPFRTGNINTGLYLLRNHRDLRAQVDRLVRTPPNGHPAWLWEQGFVAAEFADEATGDLPSQRYFYPYFDGLPGGMLGYDWRANPCGFVSVHFGGLHMKPTDEMSRALVGDILGRHRAA